MYVVVKIVVTISHRDLPVAKKNIFRPLRAIKIRRAQGPQAKSKITTRELSIQGNTS
jgi:hypothetical protein